MVVTVYVATKATAPSCSTIRRTSDRACCGSPRSSPKTTFTGWPDSPPRTLTSATQARVAGGMAATCAPITPDAVPNDPSTTGDRTGTGNAAGAAAAAWLAVEGLSRGAVTTSPGTFVSEVVDVVGRTGVSGAVGTIAARSDGTEVASDWTRLERA